MAELSGSLTSFNLGSILRLLAELTKSGRLHVSDERWIGELFLKHGQVVSASFGLARGLGGPPSDTLRGLAALDAIVLVMPDAAFFVAEGEPPPQRTIALSVSDLRARVAAMDKERITRGLTEVPLAAVPRRVDARDQPSMEEQLVIDRSALGLLLDIDGQRTVLELVGERDLLRTLTDLTWLADHSLVTVNASLPAWPEGAPRPTDQEPPRAGAHSDAF
jgi:hypothetical protein